MENEIYETTGQNKRHIVNGHVFAHFTKNFYNENQDEFNLDPTFSFVANQESIKDVLEMANFRIVGSDYDPELIPHGCHFEMIGLISSLSPFMTQPCRVDFRYHHNVLPRPSFTFMTPKVLDFACKYLSLKESQYKDFKLQVSVNENSMYQLYEASLELVGVLEEDEYAV